MNYLCRGTVSAEKLNKLMEFTRNEAAMQQALFDHVVRGFTRESAAVLNGVDAGNLCKAFKRLNRIARLCEELKQIERRELVKLVDNTQL